MCIADAYVGDRGPRVQFGQVLRVKNILEDRGEVLYEFREHPSWGYTASGFVRLSRICGVKILCRAKKKSLLKRLTNQLTLAFKFL